MVENNRARQLLSEVQDFESRLNASRRELEGIRRSCKHTWEAHSYDPIRKPTYTIPADPPGTMGVDRRVSPIHVPEEVIPRWKRTCPLCTLTEYTTETNDMVTKTPRFNKT